MRLCSAALLGVALAAGSSGEKMEALIGAAPPPPNPYEILQPQLLRTPHIDAIPICVPRDIDAELITLLGLAAEGSLERAQQIWQEVGGPAVPSSGDGEPQPQGSAARELTGMILKARTPDDRNLLVPVVQGLRVLAQQLGSTDSRVCALLELARLELVLGRFPEATGEAVRAHRLAQDLGLPRVRIEAADFFRAEGLYQSGWQRAADEIYRSLSHSEDPRTAAAARLRVADVVFDLGERASVLRDYETLLKRGEVFGANPNNWVLRVSESAIAAGRYSVAADWLERFVVPREPVVPIAIPQAEEGGARRKPTHAVKNTAATEIARKPEEEPIKDERLHSRSGALVEIRLADLDVLRGNARGARKRLAEVQAIGQLTEPSLLAELRLVDLGIDKRRPGPRIERLRSATKTKTPTLASYALGLLGHELQPLARVDESLAVLTRLVYEAPPRWLTPHLEDDIAAALRHATAKTGSDDECVAVVRRLGGRYSLLVNYAEDLTPFIALGGCYEKLGLAALAGDVYRTLVRSTGGKAADLIALPLARTSLAEGDVGVVRTAAAGQVRRRKEHAFTWLMLLGEAELIDGRTDRSMDLLRDLVRSGQPEGERLRAIVAFAMSFDGGDPSNSDQTILSRALRDLSREEREVDPRGFAEATLTLAQLERAAGRRVNAISRYADVASALPAGHMHAQALYWMGDMDPRLSEARVTWQRVASDERGGPWKSLAELELRMIQLRRDFSSWPVQESTVRSRRLARREAGLGGTP